MNISYTEAIKKADALKELFEYDIYLNASDPDLPWELVTNVEGGGSIRLQTDVSLKIVAHHYIGLRFYWYTDIEPRSSNGAKSLQLDMQKIADIMHRLPKGPESN